MGLLQYVGYGLLGLITFFLAIAMPFIFVTHLGSGNPVLIGYALLVILLLVSFYFFSRMRRVV